MSPIEQAFDELGWVFERGVREGTILIKPFPIYDQEESLPGETAGGTAGAESAEDASTKKIREDSTPEARPIANARYARRGVTKFRRKRKE